MVAGTPDFTSLIGKTIKGTSPFDGNEDEGKVVGFGILPGRQQHHAANVVIWIHRSDDAVVPICADAVFHIVPTKKKQGI